MRVIASRMSLKSWAVPLEDKLCLAIEVVPHNVFKPLRVAEVGFYSEDIGQPILEMNQINER